MVRSVNATAFRAAVARAAVVCVTVTKLAKNSPVWTAPVVSVADVRSIVPCVVSNSVPTRNWSPAVSSWNTCDPGRRYLIVPFTGAASTVFPKTGGGTSAGGWNCCLWTGVCELDWLFPKSAGSSPGALAVAEFVTVLGLFARLRIVTVPEPPGPRRPRLAWTERPAAASLRNVVAIAHSPWVVSQETNDTVPGRSSATLTPSAAPGPRFVTMILYVIQSPAPTFAGVAVISRRRSKASETTPTSVVLLLAGLGSGASLETSGETTRLPIAVDRSMRSIVADPPAARFRRRADGAARFPRKQRTLSVRTQTPWLAVTETNVAPAGIAIATSVSSARSGPLFVTTMW